MLARTLHCMGETMWLLGQRSEAVSHVLKALEYRRRCLHCDSAELLECMSLAATCLRAMSQPEAALPPVEELLEKRRRLLPPRDPTLVQAMEDAAAVYHTLSRSEEALALYVRVP